MLRAGLVPKPYVMLLDINMPRLNGMDTLAELRSDAELCEAVVFLFTTSKDQQDKLRAYQQHVAGYVVKQPSLNGMVDLVAMLDRYCSVVDLPMAE